MFTLAHGRERLDLSQPKLLFEIDIAGTYLFASAISEAHLVVPLSEVEGRTLNELVPTLPGCSSRPLNKS